MLGAHGSNYGNCRARVCAPGHPSSRFPTSLFLSQHNFHRAHIRSEMLAILLPLRPLASLNLSFSCSLSLSFSLTQCTPQVTSNSPLHHARGGCRAHITSSTPSLRSRCPSATTRSLVVPRPAFVSQRTVLELTSLVSFAIIT